MEQIIFLDEFFNEFVEAFDQEFKDYNMEELRISDADSETHIYNKTGEIALYTTKNKHRNGVECKRKKNIFLVNVIKDKDKKLIGEYTDPDSAKSVFNECCTVLGFKPIAETDVDFYNGINNTIKPLKNMCDVVEK